MCPPMIDIFKREHSLLTLLGITFFSFFLFVAHQHLIFLFASILVDILVAILVNLLARAYQIEIRVHLTLYFQVPHLY